MSALLALLLPLHVVGALAAPAPPAAAAPAIAPERAVARALNRLRTTADGLVLDHPRHRARFTPSGVTVRPRAGRLDWSWSLVGVTAAGAAVAGVDSRAVAPRADDASGRVVYRRGAVTEVYLPKRDTVEQLFVLEEPLPLAGADLVIGGRVASSGRFAATSDGWRWRRGAAAVTLGRVTVFDAVGARLPAAFEVAATATRIRVDGAALSAAAYPVTVDPEIGTNDFRISEAGPDGDSFVGQAHSAAAAYNPVDLEVLVVWEGDVASDQQEILGQRIDATTGMLVGDTAFRVSDMGPESVFGAVDPVVVYNPVDHEYLVVWSGEDSGDDEFEIYGQRLEAATGAAVGEDDFLVSGLFGGVQPAAAYNPVDHEILVAWVSNARTRVQRLDAATGAELGADDDLVSDTGFKTDLPAVAHAAGANEYLVVWQVEHDASNGELGIFGQRVDAATGSELGGDFQISTSGPPGDGEVEATDPAVTSNPTAGEYLVVWNADAEPDGVPDPELEIFGQRVEEGTGAVLEPVDLRFSSMGPDGDDLFDGITPHVAYDATLDQYLVVWSGEEETFLVHEIYGQRLDGFTAAEIGTNDFQISRTAGALRPDVVHDPVTDEYVVVWESDLSDFDREIWGRRLSATAFSGDFRVSDLGPIGDGDFVSSTPGIAADGSGGFLVVWDGDQDDPALGDEENEIWGQRLRPRALWADDWDDGVLTDDWSFELGSWQEAEGELVGVPGDDGAGGLEARAVADPAFEGCAVCTVIGRLAVSDGTDPAAVELRLYGWYEGPDDHVVLTLEPGLDRVRLTQVEAGVVVDEQVRAGAPIAEDVLYLARIVHDGARFRVTVQGLPVFDVAAVISAPDGSVALGAREGTVRGDLLAVVP